MRFKNLQNIFQKEINSRLDAICKNFYIWKNQELILSVISYVE